MDKSSRKYLAVKTHKVLFQTTRLRYGIHFATEIFQTEMEKRLSHVLFTVLRMGDILISGKNDNEPFQSLESVLDIVKKVVCDWKS